MPLPGTNPSTLPSRSPNDDAGAIPVEPTTGRLVQVGWLIVVAMSALAIYAVHLAQTSDEKVPPLVMLGCALGAVGGTCRFLLSTPATTRSRAWQVTGLSLVGYLLLSVLWWHALLGQLGSATLAGGQGDAGLFLSWLQWAAHAVTHGINPLHNTFVQAPAGVSALWNTSVLALGIPLTPVTELFGATASLNLILILSPALSCWTCSMWLRRHTGAGPAALGALIYGFSPFAVAHLDEGHLHLAFLALLPLIVMLSEDLLFRAERPSWPTAPLLGLLIAVQYFIGSEVLLMLAVSGVPTVVLLAALNRETARARAKKALQAVGIAVAVAAGLLAYPLLDQFSPDYRIKGPIISPISSYVTSVRHLLIPTTSLYLHAPASATRGLNAFENGTYFGIPMLVVLAGTVIVLRKRQLVQVAAAVAAVAVWCELDPHVGRVPLSPLAIVQHFVGLTQDMLPVRFASVFFLAAALLTALGLAEAVRRLAGRRLSGAVGAALVALTILSLVPRPATTIGPLPATPAFFTSSALRQTIPAGSTVMIAPMATVTNTKAQYWQVAAGMWFKQLGGYDLNNLGVGTPSFFPRELLLTQLFGVNAKQRPYALHLTRALLRQAREELHNSGATFFLIGPSGLAARLFLARARELLGRNPDLDSGAVEIWKLRNRCSDNSAVGPLCPTARNL